MGPASTVFVDVAGNDDWESTAERTDKRFFADSIGAGRDNDGSVDSKFGQLEPRHVPAIVLHLRHGIAWLSLFCPWFTGSRSFLLAFAGVNSFDFRTAAGRPAGRPSNHAGRDLAHEGAGKHRRGAGDRV
jgi:hypothetical protein